MMDGSDMNADRLAVIAPSLILGLMAQALKLKALGHPVIDLGIGEPDFKTPDHIKKAACQAIKNDETRYTLVAGTPMLRTAIRNKLKRDNNLDYPLDNITVSGGAKQVIFNAYFTVLLFSDTVYIDGICGGDKLDIQRSLT